MKKLLLALSLLTCALTTSCATDPSRDDLKSPCASIDHPNSPCIRKSPIENTIA